MSGKKIVEFEIYKDDGKQTSYTGRMLGFVTANEYNAALRDLKIAKRLSTVETTTVKELGKIADIENLRFAVMLRTKNGVPVVGKKLFFSERLSITSNLIDPDDITFVTQSDACILLTEKEERINGQSTAAQE